MADDAAWHLEGTVIRAYPIGHSVANASASRYVGLSRRATSTALVELTSTCDSIPLLEAEAEASAHQVLTNTKREPNVFIFFRALLIRRDEG